MERARVFERAASEWASPVVLIPKKKVKWNHEPLCWVLNLSSATGRLARWRLRLAEFDYVCQYRPGVKNNVADGVSRLRTTGGCGRWYLEPATGVATKVGTGRPSGHPRPPGDGGDSCRRRLGYDEPDAGQA